MNSLHMYLFRLSCELAFNSYCGGWERIPVILLLLSQLMPKHLLLQTKLDGFSDHSYFVKKSSLKFEGF